MGYRIIVLIAFVFVGCKEVEPTPPPTPEEVAAQQAEEYASLEETHEKLSGTVVEVVKMKRKYSNSAGQVVLRIRLDNDKVVKAHWIVAGQNENGPRLQFEEGTRYSFVHDGYILYGYKKDK